MIKPSVPELGSFDWVHLDSNCSESNVHHLGVGVLLVEFEQVVRSNFARHASECVLNPEQGRRTL